MSAQERAAKVRVYNYVKFETGLNLPPVGSREPSMGMGMEAWNRDILLKHL